MCTSYKTGNCTHQLQIKERKTRIVVLISIGAMFLEIIFGYITKSMALLSDGWHMSSHVIAIGAGWYTYKYVISKQSNNKLKSNPEKIFSLTGYTNALILLAIAGIMLFESVERFLSPVTVNYNEAIIVSFIGLFVNIISAKVLHHDASNSDTNIRATYLHVLADVLTSVLAIIALFGGSLFRINFLDSVMGIIGSAIIIYWAVGLIKTSSKELVNSEINFKNLKPNFKTSNSA